MAGFAEYAATRVNQHNPLMKRGFDQNRIALPHIKHHHPIIRLIPTPQGKYNKPANCYGPTLPRQNQHHSKNPKHSQPAGKRTNNNLPRQVTQPNEDGL